MLLYAPSMILEANGGTRTFSKDTVMVGREGSSELYLNQPKISRRHAAFRRANDAWYVQDLGSTNGTWVNGKKLEANKPVRLQEGAKIDFAHSFQVVFHQGNMTSVDDATMGMQATPYTPAQPVPYTPPVQPVQPVPYTPPVQPRYTAPVYDAQPVRSAPQPAYDPQPVYDAQAYDVQPVYDAQGYDMQPAYDAQIPAVQAAVPLRDHRSFWKVFFLGAITFGIYPLVVYSHVSRDINTIASPYDGKHTMHYMLAMLLTGVTFGVFGLVWMHQLCRRIADEQTRRGMVPDVTPKTFWLWGILGSMIVAGVFIFGIRLFRGMNALAADYNAKGY